MNIAKIFYRFSLITISILVISCDSDDAIAPKNREIKFEVSGTFSGTLDATYITASAGGTNESIPTLPWTKNISYSSSAPSTGITVGGSGGVSGQSLTVKVFAGERLVSTTPGVSNNMGIVVVASPSYVF